jgi:ABC-2 type transport system permease protein/fluoroquinolone transport system permease protein
MKQDSKVALRNYFHLVILILAVLMSLIINFAIPEEVKLTPTELFFDNTPGKVFQEYLISEGVERDRFFNTREALKEEVRKKDNSLGIIVEGELDRARVTIIHQGTESEEILNLLDATIESALDRIRGIERETNHRVEYLRPKSAPVPFNKNTIPVIVFMEAIMLGFLLIAVMVFQEKEEGSIRAYRVSPGGTLEYILSKATVNMGLGVIYATLLVMFTMGFRVNYPALLALVALSSFFITMLGLAVSAFFRNLQEFLFVGVFILSILAFPVGSYYSPAFSPDIITWLPSYPILFGVREILFPTGKTGFIASLNLLLIAESLGMLLISYLVVKRRLMKEGR